MEFRLVYHGDLASDGNASQKHAIRRFLHPQLRHLWNNQRNLKALAEDFGIGKLEDGIEIIANNWPIGGFRFVPLVAKKMCLRCSLDILLLRREQPGRIYMKGDIDGRLKTVFDALRMPHSMDETGKQGPQNDENPFFVMLEDDELISEITVTTDQLLWWPPDREYERNYASVIIKVQLKPTTRDAPHAWAFE